MSTEQVIASILERQKSIKSVRVTYDVTSTSFADPATIGPNEVWGDTRFTFVIERDRRFCRKTHSDTAYPQVTASFDGQNTRKHLNRSVLVLAGKARECEDGEMYCSMILQLPYSDANQSDRRNSWILSDVLHLHKENYHLRPQREQIDGSWCHVLEWAKRDTIWIDPNLGWAVRKRINFYSDRSNHSVHKQLEYSLTKFVEGAPGIWVPKSAVLTMYRRPLDGDAAEPFASWMFNVIEVQINQVQESDFEINGDELRSPK